MGVCAREAGLSISEMAALLGFSSLIKKNRCAKPYPERPSVGPDFHSNKAVASH